MKYRNQIEKLILMSPVGVSETPEAIKRPNFINNRQSWLSRFGAKWLMDMWQESPISPFDVWRTIGYRATKILERNNLMKRFRSGTFGEEESEVVLEAVVQMGMRRKSTDEAIFQLLAPLAYS